MASSVKEEDIESVMLKVNSVLKLTDFGYTVSQFKNIGQNYFGIVVPVTVTGEDNKKKVTLSLVLKLAPTDERYRVSNAVHYMFTREIFVYETILQKYHTFVRELPLDVQYVIPKCYYVSKEDGKESIVTQNMCADGYKVILNHKYFDFDHMKISLETLAIFHSLSFILEQRDDQLYSTEISNHCRPLMEKYNNRFMEVLQDRLQKAIKIFEGTEYIVKLLSELKTNCVKHIEAATLSVFKLCICHGDIWKENILYKYDESSRPVSACLIDYQATRICSPALDVLYLITISADSNLRKEHYKGFLNIYYDKLSKVLCNAGLKNCYPREKFDLDLATVAPACLILANTSLWLSNGLQEEGHVRS